MGLFKCHCGEEFTTRITYITNNIVKSCGCLQKAAVAKTGHKNKTHGLSSSDEFAIYKTIKQRCYNPNNRQYKDYGGRGIVMSDEWRDNFMAFYRDMCPRPAKNLSVHRIDNDGPYSKENCKWATMKEHGTAKRNNRIIEFNGKTQTLQQWCDELKMDHKTLTRRLDILEWTIEEALTIPVENNERLLTYDGRTQTLSAWSRETGLKITTILTRLDKIKMSVEDSLTKPLEGKGKMVTYQGKTQNLFTWSKETGINLDTLTYRLKVGKPLEEVFTKKNKYLQQLSPNLLMNDLIDLI